MAAQKKTAMTIRLHIRLMEKLEKIIKADTKAGKRPYSKSLMVDLAVDEWIKKYCEKNNYSL